MNQRSWPDHAVGLRLVGLANRLALYWLFATIVVGLDVMVGLAKVDMEIVQLVIRLSIPTVIIALHVLGCHRLRKRPSLIAAAPGLLLALIVAWGTAETASQEGVALMLRNPTSWIVLPGLCCAFIAYGFYGYAAIKAKAQARVVLRDTFG